MSGHNADNVENKRCKLIGAFCHDLYNGKSQRLYHFFDLLKIILSYAGIAQSVENHIRYIVHDLVNRLVLDYIDEFTEIFNSALAQDLNKRVPLIGICTDERYNELLGGIDLSSCGENLGKQLLNEAIEEFTLSHGDAVIEIYYL